MQFKKSASTEEKTKLIDGLKTQGVCCRLSLSARLEGMGYKETPHDFHEGRNPPFDKERQLEVLKTHPLVWLPSLSLLLHIWVQKHIGSGVNSVDDTGQTSKAQVHAYPNQTNRS